MVGGKLSSQSWSLSSCNQGEPYSKVPLNFWKSLDEERKRKLERNVQWHSNSRCKKDGKYNNSISVLQKKEDVKDWVRGSVGLCMTGCAWSHSWQVMRSRPMGHTYKDWDKIEVFLWAYPILGKKKGKRIRRAGKRKRTEKRTYKESEIKNSNTHFDKRDGSKVPQ